MPRFEILYHATCDLPCASAEEAAAILRAQVTGTDGGQALVHQLAVWRADADAAASPLDTAARTQMDAFFREVDRCAQEAEARFRGDVEAILLALPLQDAAGPTTDDESEPSCTK
jgi:hypothetical protein